MIHQSVLDLNPPFDLLAGLAQPHSGDDSTRVEFRRFPAPRGLRRKSVPDFEHLSTAQTWIVEPYRGLESVPWAETASARARRPRILVNEAVPEALGRELSRPGNERLSITLGDPFEAYPSVEQRFRITRSVLQTLGETRGHQIDLTTRSPLVLRDQDLLRKLDLSHAVTVQIPIASLDAGIAARFEPGTATPESRLGIVRSLARDGISVVVSCGPILPGINSSADELDPLFAAIRRAGAIDVIGNSHWTAPKHRRRVAAWLERNFPRQAASILARLATGRNVSHLGTLDRLRLSYGFPLQRAGRG
jgi:DNA repair photolyase